ncbi:MAG: peptidoglycan-associated lipoprotein Pal [Deltaproteobacteria bacterium]|nr:peptidoglycan-associated lipoprotein Pal [Deltaproteobacteria bacterium]
MLNGRLVMIVSAFFLVFAAGCAKEAPKPPKQDLSKVDAAKDMVKSAVDGSKFNVVYFDYDKSNIKPEFKDAIKLNAELIKAAKGTTIMVEGHCDERGTTEYNLALGERRAQSTKKAIAAKGADSKQMETISYGEERPAEPGHDEAAWSKNRRTVLSLK